MSRHADRVAVVTGGASGIGAEIAFRLSEEGAAGVVIVDQDEEAAAHLIDRISGHGGSAVFAGADVSNEEGCEAAVAAAVREWGRVDVLVAAAGISHARYAPRRDVTYGSGDTRAPLIDTNTADWNRVLDVNLNGVMFANRAAARTMITQGHGGAIVNIASINARRAVAGIAPYCVSKAAVWMLTRCLALELAEHRIRVNAVAPGYIDTPMNDAMRRDEARLAQVLASTPLSRLGNPAEVAAAVAFLTSADSSFITGSLIEVDGGIDAAHR